MFNMYMVKMFLLKLPSPSPGNRTSRTLMPYASCDRHQVYNISTLDVRNMDVNCTDALVSKILASHSRGHGPQS